MKRYLSISCAICILLSGLLLSGCAPQGLSMISLSDVQGSFFDQYNGTKDAYLCRIRDNAPAELTIPGEYNGKPVVALETDTTLKRLDSLEIGDGIQILSDVLRFMDQAPESVTVPASVSIINYSFSDSQRVKTVVIEGDISRLDWCFNNCADLQTVEIRGSVEAIDGATFKYCPSLKKITINGDVKQIGSDSFSDLKALEEVTIGGTVQNVENGAFSRCPVLKTVNYASCPDNSMEKSLYTAKTASDAITEKALSKLGQPFDKKKEISVDDAPKYAEVLNGPVLGMTICADCPYTEYAVDKVPEGTDLRVFSTQAIDDAFPDTVVTAEKIQKINSGKADMVYCLVERIGYSDGPEYLMSPSGYYMHFRISLWNSKTDELIAWYTERVGAAPFSYTIGKEQIFYDFPTGSGTKNFHKDENKKEPTPLSIIEKDIFKTVNTAAY